MLILRNLKTHLTGFLFLIWVIFVSMSIISCKSTKKSNDKKPSEDNLLPSDQVSSTDIQNKNPLGINIEVEGQTGTSFNFPVGNPVKIQFKISAIQNINDLLIVMIKAPSGSQLISRDTLNPQFVWGGSTVAQIVPLTLLIRNMVLCKEKNPQDIQSCDIPVGGGGLALNAINVSSVYDSIFDYTINITGITSISDNLSNSNLDNLQDDDQNKTSLLNWMWDKMKQYGSSFWEFIKNLFNKNSP